eukprot:CAMPEP_0178933382 /NCGR_PEP_ID=MMETSP0786-20121207/23230_1 /TAXON_ID=186022 /ORGANISM="Thalassionema frauenfeldii, Strain CCMP 1798" /LENGTH=741 /DNA_ID=CAMNT_0020610955 /DNA_START=178 /DNA_END=2403 /DNA_ORIENTATION=-
MALAAFLVGYCLSGKWNPSRERHKKVVEFDETSNPRPRINGKETVGETKVPTTNIHLQAKGGEAIVPEFCSTCSLSNASMLLELQDPLEKHMPEIEVKIVSLWCDGIPPQMVDERPATHNAETHPELATISSPIHEDRVTSAATIQACEKGAHTREQPLLSQEQQITSAKTKEVPCVDCALCNAFSRMATSEKETLSVFLANSTEEKPSNAESLEDNEKDWMDNDASEDNLCDAFSALDLIEKPQLVINEEATQEWLSSHLDDLHINAKAVGAYPTEWHQSLPLKGGHAHSLLVCYNGRLTDEEQANQPGGIPYEVVDEIAKLDDRGGASEPLDSLQKHFLTKKKDRLRKLAVVKMFSKDGQTRLLDYLRDGKCCQNGVADGVWFGARCFAHLPLWPEDDTKLNVGDVCQGDIDDCYFACGLSLAAEHYPTCLKDRIVRIDDKENGRSYFQVRHWFERRGGCISPNPKSRKGPKVTEVGDTYYAYRRVNRKGGPGVPLYCRSRSDALYPMVLERAFQKYRSGGDLGSYEDIAGKNCLEAEAVLHFLTGLRFEQMKLTIDTQIRSIHKSLGNQVHYRIWKVICNALVKGRAISAGTYSMGSKRNEKHHDEWEDPHIIPDHNYALIDAGKDSVHGHFVVLRNPHGKQLSPFVLSSVSAWPKGIVDGAELREDAVFRLGLSEFFSYFDTISYAAETCAWYPIKRCHRYREFFADSENVEWCPDEMFQNEKREKDALKPRRLVFE